MFMGGERRSTFQYNRRTIMTGLSRAASIIRKVAAARKLG